MGLLGFNNHGKAWVYEFDEGNQMKQQCDLNHLHFSPIRLSSALLSDVTTSAASMVAINLRAFFYRDEVADDLEEYKQSYTDILIKLKDYKKFERAMIRAARGNYRRKMEIYLSIIDECRSKNYISFEIPYSILKTAVLFSQHGEL